MVLTREKGECIDWREYWNAWYSRRENHCQASEGVSVHEEPPHVWSFFLPGPRRERERGKQGVFIKRSGRGGDTTGLAYVFLMK